MIISLWASLGFESFEEIKFGQFKCTLKTLDFTCLHFQIFKFQLKSPFRNFLQETFMKKHIEFWR